MRDHRGERLILGRGRYRLPGGDLMVGVKEKQDFLRGSKEGRGGECFWSNEQTAKRSWGKMKNKLGQIMKGPEEPPESVCLPWGWGHSCSPSGGKPQCGL